MQSGLPKKRREHVRASTPARVVEVLPHPWDTGDRTGLRKACVASPSAIREVARSPEMYRSYIEERVGQPPVWSSVATGADGRPVPGAAVPRETSSPSG